MSGAFHFGVERPSVGLLNVGEEEQKGNQLVKETRKLLASLEAEA